MAYEHGASDPWESGGVKGAGKGAGKGAVISTRGAVRNGHGDVEHPVPCEPLRGGVPWR